MLTNILVRLPLTNDKIMIYDLDNLLKMSHHLGNCPKRFSNHSVCRFEIFRFIYESEMKDEKRNKEANNKYFVLVQRDAYVPYDILQHFYSKRISLRDLFPKLSHVVVKEVYADCMERLYDVYQNYEGEELGDDGTKNYLLNFVYGIYVEQIESFMDLVKHLVSIYYQGLSISPLIGEYLIKRLSFQEKFSQYPLHKLISSPHSFFHFLQEQWSLYVKSIKDGALKEES